MHPTPEGNINCGEWKAPKKMYYRTTEDNKTKWNTTAYYMCPACGQIFDSNSRWTKKALIKP